jgi:hypothetical protein
LIAISGTFHQSAAHGPLQRRSIRMKALLLLRTSQVDDVFSMNVEVNDCGRQNEIIRRGSVMAM